MALPRLVIGNRNYSSWSLRPWLYLRQSGIAFETVRLPLETPEFDRRIGALSPTRRVPVLWVDDEVIWDSLAICEVANERWCGGVGWPTGSRARAAARCAAAEMHSGFSALRAQLPMNARRRPSPRHWDAAAQADIDRVQALWSQLRAGHGAGGDFLCGEFGIVDAMFAPVCLRFLSYGVSRSPLAEAYLAAVMALPAMAEWMADAAAEAESLPATDEVGAA